MTEDKKRKGFAGLDSMISDVETPKPTPEPESKSESAPISRVESQQGYAPPPLSSGGGSGKWWVIGICVVAFFAWIGGLDKNSSARTTSSPSYSAPTPAPYYPPVTPSYVPEPAPVIASNAEEMPPVGNGMSFNRGQIRYCLSEKIRMSAWQGQVNEYSETSVDDFNQAVNDYNMRCSNFRYRSGMLESVRTEVETNRYALHLEGINRAAATP